MRNSDRKFDWRTVLGLQPWRDRDLIRARTGVLAEFSGRAGTLVLTQLLAAVIAFKTLLPIASTFALALFGLALTLLLLQISRLKNGIETGAAPISFAGVQWRLSGIGLGLGLLWGAGCLGLTSTEYPSSQYVIYMLLAGLITVSALALCPLPLPAMFLVAGLGMGGTFLGWQLGSPDLAFMMLMFTAGMAITSYAAGRRLIQRLYGERRLAEQNEVVRLLLKEFEDSSGDILWEVDAGRRLENISPRLAAFFGETVESLHGRALADLFSSGHAQDEAPSDDTRRIADTLRNHVSFRELLVPVTIAGEERWCELSASPRYDDDNRFIGFRGVLSDVTSQQKSARRIHHMARYDTLTGLPNRLHISEALQESVIRCQQQTRLAGFLMIDLDRFKAVNDTLGHPVGDRLLEQVAERLRGLMGPKDLAARLGGDEFAVLMRDLDDVGRMEALAEKIIAALSCPYQVGEHVLYIGASIGSALCPRDGHVADKLVRNADLALYQAKDEGRGTHRQYAPELYARAQERRSMEFALRDALERGEFSLEYQPIVSAADKEIIACEALLRWCHPELGVIPPDQFIPVAEEARLISPIGAWVMRTACMEAANWPPHVRVAVNLSIEQFKDRQLFETIVAALAHSGLEATRLELEVTESVFLKEQNDILQTLERLIGLGVHVSLDDFGTSYSSLGFLGRTRFSTIKIDRRYVREAALDTLTSQAVIRAVVAMADSLSINITAEGTESDEELAMIRALGCDQVQGYLVSRPLSAGDIRALFAAPERRLISSAA